MKLNNQTRKIARKSPPTKPIIRIILKKEPTSLEEDLGFFIIVILFIEKGPFKKIVPSK